MSLIALMSIGVISLVVWLILLFLSVTDGIEKQWLKKLTSLNGPIRISPTEEYYRSYYYQIDSLSDSSNYRLKNIGDKLLSEATDPYHPEVDQQLPSYFPKKLTHQDETPVDLVKELFSILEGLKIKAQDYELSGALFKLRSVRPHGALFSKNREVSHAMLTQVSFISTFCEKNPVLKELLEKPRVEDLNHLFFLLSTPYEHEPILESEKSGAKRETFQARLKPLLAHTHIKKMKSSSLLWNRFKALLPEGETLSANGIFKEGELSQLLILEKGGKGNGILKNEQGVLTFTPNGAKSLILGEALPLYLEKPLEFDAALAPYELEDLTSLQDLYFDLNAKLQGKNLSGRLPWEEIEISKCPFDFSSMALPYR